MTLHCPAQANVFPPRRRAPARAGIGFKPQHARDILEACVEDVGFLEVHAENYMGDGGMPHRHLAALRERFPISLHGVGLSIGGETLDLDHLERLRVLVVRYEPEWVSEHLAWSSHGGVFFNDLLPLAYDAGSLARVVRHLDIVQDALSRPILLENPSTYVAFETSTWDEVDFIREVARRSGCGLLLDVNNVQVSCVNHGRDPRAYIDAFPVERVGEMHLAGYAQERAATGDRLLIDAHDRAVQPDVWALYAHALAACGPVPTLVEWDNDVPDARTLLAEAAKADAMLARAPARASAA